jgi:hypothetical protein
MTWIAATSVDEGDESSEPNDDRSWPPLAVMERTFPQLPARDK